MNKFEGYEENTISVELTTDQELNKIQLYKIKLFIRAAIGQDFEIISSNSKEGCILKFKGVSAEESNEETMGNLGASFALISKICPGIKIDIDNPSSPKKRNLDIT